MTSALDLRNAVGASPGCRLVGLRNSDTVGGNIPIGSIVCANGWQAAKLLVELCKQDARDPMLRDLAHQLRQRGGGSDRGFAEMLCEYVQDNIAFVREQGEIFQGPAYTLAARAGDCDDHVRIVYGVARAGGLPARLAFLAKKGAPGPAHVVAQIGLPEGWTWAETTIAAYFGEHPIDAAKRVGAIREDLDPNEMQIQTMGSLGGLTDSIDDDFFSLLASWERATGGDAEGALALMSKESGLDPHAGPNSIGAVGINQFIPKTLGGVYSGSPESFRQMSASQQLPFVLRFWNALKPGAIRNGRDLYWANFLPACVQPGAPDSFVIAGPSTGCGGISGSTLVRANPSLSHDGQTITAGDLATELEKQTTKPKYIEAVARLNKARGGGSPSSFVAGGASFIAATALVLAMGGAGYLAATKLKL